MATPPTALPSPTPSSSSQSHYQNMSGLQPSRAPSAASGASGQHYGHNGEGPNYDYHNTPQPMQHHLYGSVPTAFLPPVTSSPPPHPPPYVPPPQHAMAPDPIHSISPGAAPVMGLMQQGYPGPGWQGHVPMTQGANGWRGNSQSVYPGQPQYRPNGHGLAPTTDAASAGRGSFSSSLGPKPVSSHGERRSHRGERRERDDSREDEEVISTIFVVGFPDDMTEREFQNMFTFATGFEAATLKFPSGSGRREPTAALLAELTQLAANQAQAAAEQGVEFSQPALEEAMAAMTMAATASTSTSTTPSAAMSLTPSAPSGPLLGNGPALPTRRQTIGFARFKTRADALAAREQLQGRKIDGLTGATFKAEMAKKNLHTKRNTSQDELVGLLLRSGRLAGLVNAAGQAQATSQSLPAQPPSAREAWDAWSNAAPPATDRPSFEEGRPGPNGSSGERQGSVAAPSYAPDPSISPSLSVKSAQRATDSKALLALAEEADELEGWSVNGAVGMGIMDGYQNTPRRPPPTGPGYGYRGPPDGFGTSPPGELADRGLLGANPADQNPPINTLYVGNLPAISPPTHPPNFLEESLRSLFARCPGFKRMSFRQKINGPMCFVEFEEVAYASQAIKDLYGHNLGGLVKGGIRLSYSKNSLGQRGNAHPAGTSGGLFGGIAHTVALAGMSMTSPGATHPIPIANGGYGQGMGDSRDSRRESAAGTSLSPTAQPFNISLPNPTSPRSRYFGTTPTSASSLKGPSPDGPAQSSTAVPIPAGNTFQPFTQGSSGPSPSSGFSPMSSPIRTPASFSWKSSGPSTSGGFGYEFGSGIQLGSLNGAASAWGAGGSGAGAGAGVERRE
ncbi:hypothetical protein IAU60_000005 [Kwoniella sp. DSM 27419]